MTKRTMRPLAKIGPGPSNKRSKSKMRRISEESAVVQMLQTVFGWTFLEMPRKADRNGMMFNFQKGTSTDCTIVRLALPPTSVLAIEFENWRKGEPKRRAQALKRRKKFRAELAAQRRAQRTAKRAALKNTLANKEA
jgi:hypothetical protein